MEVFIREASSVQPIKAHILPVTGKELPLKKDGWQFTWRELYRTAGAKFFKLVVDNNPKIIEGILMVSIVNNEMVVMNNVELSPHNIGKNGKYDLVAGCLIAYACYYSFNFGKGHYNGFLSFESKTELIELYHRKYGATLAMGQKMFIDDVNGKKLIQKYLDLDL